MKRTRLLRTGRIGLAAALVLALVIVLSPRAVAAPSAHDTLTVLSYNVDNLFDAVNDGSEYPEFRPGSGQWDAHQYQDRLRNTAKVILDSVPGGPDVVVLEEIENRNVLRTLADGYLRSAGYRNSVMVPVPGSAVNVGLLTRFPVTRVAAHEVWAGTVHPLRNILEVTLDVHGTPLTIFACHWKAKSGGGAERTEEARRIAAGIIITRVEAILRKTPDAEILVAGDLNENEDEYERVAGRYQTAIIDIDPADMHPTDSAKPLLSSLPKAFARHSIFVVGHPSAFGGGESSTRLVLFSPWDFASGSSDDGVKGSYWFRGRWETIDQFLLSPGLTDSRGLSFRGFSVVVRDYLLNRSGHPRAYSERTRSGYSDHFPILLTLALVPRH